MVTGQVFVWQGSHIFFVTQGICLQQSETTEYVQRISQKVD